MEFKRFSTFLAVTIASSCFATADALAQPAFGVTSVTGAIGLADPEVLGSTFQMGVRSDVATLADGVHLETGLHYWQKGYSEVYGGYDDWTYRDLALTSGAKYEFPSSSAFFPYVRGGLGLHFESNSFGGESYGTTNAGLYVGGGANYPVGNALSIGGDLSYHVTGANHLLFGIQLSYAMGN